MKLRYWGETFERLDEIAFLRHINLCPCGSYDRYGNRVFRSRDYVYFDRDEKLLESALLLTSSGQRLVKAYRWCLSDISQALHLLEETGPLSNDSELFISLKHGGKISFLDNGGQSRVYLVDFDGNDKYVIKVKIRRTDGIDVSQPYINELLQIQGFARDRGLYLAQYNIELPEIMFATSSVSCMRFVEGTMPSREDLKVLYLMEKALDDYMLMQRRGISSLWCNVYLDLMITASQWKPHNFIKRSDGKLVLIDPFVYASVIY